MKRKLYLFICHFIPRRLKHGAPKIMGSLVIILQGNIFVELRTILYLCRRRLISWGEYGTTVKEEKRNGNLPCDGLRLPPLSIFYFTRIV